MSAADTGIEQRVESSIEGSGGSGRGVPLCSFIVLEASCPQLPADFLKLSEPDPDHLVVQQ